MRRYGKINPHQKYQARPGVYAIIIQGNSLLATVQNMPEPELQLPGGGVEKAEHPLNALHREVLEETGWHINIIRRLGAFRNYKYMSEYDKWAEKICSIYLARPVRYICEPSEPGHQPVWLKLSDATDLLNCPADRDFLSNFLCHYQNT